MRCFFLFFILTIFFSQCLSFQIVFTSDLHETLNVDGFGPAGLIEWLSGIDRDKTLVLDGGDLFDSKIQLPFVGDRRSSVLEYVKKVGYDAMVLGNHEYYFSHEWLQEYKKINKSLIGANVQDLEPFRIFDIDGVKIAVIGLSTIQHLANRVEYHNDLPKDPFESLRKVLEILPKVDYIICLNHLQHESDIKILQSFPKIDLILSGHDHRGPELKKIQNSYLFEAASHAESIYLIDVDPIKKNVTYEKLKLPTNYILRDNTFGTLLLAGVLIGIFSILWVFF
ncbi:MAG TPA: metallophosphoesterase [Pseudothermotoga sp.]